MRERKIKLVSCSQDSDVSVKVELTGFISQKFSCYDMAMLAKWLITRRLQKVRFISK